MLSFTFSHPLTRSLPHLPSPPHHPTTPPPHPLTHPLPLPSLVRACESALRNTVRLADAHPIPEDPTTSDAPPTTTTPASATKKPGAALVKSATPKSAPTTPAHAINAPAPSPASASKAAAADGPPPGPLRPTAPGLTLASLQSLFCNPADNTPLSANDVLAIGGAGLLLHACALLRPLSERAVLDQSSTGRLIASVWQLRALSGVDAEPDAVALLEGEWAQGLRGRAGVAAGAASGAGAGEGAGVAAGGAGAGGVKGGARGGGGTGYEPERDSKDTAVLMTMRKMQKLQRDTGE